MPYHLDCPLTLYVIDESKYLSSVTYFCIIRYGTHYLVIMHKNIYKYSWEPLYLEQALLSFMAYLNATSVIVNDARYVLDFTCFLQEELENLNIEESRLDDCIRFIHFQNSMSKTYFLIYYLECKSSNKFSFISEKCKKR